MEYRNLGRTGLRVSAVSLGTEYLLNLPRQQVVEVIHAALDAGINYFDLFFAQPEFRDNMGEAFAGCRQEALLAAHLGAIHPNGQYDKTRDPGIAAEMFTDFLRRYHTDYADLVYIHNVDSQEDYDQVMGPGGIGELAVRYKQEGKARAIGFSGHTVSTSRQAVESGILDVLMYPVNMAGHDIPERRELLQLCAVRGVAVVAMKPYAGGKLLLPNRTVKVEKSQRGGESLNIESPAAITPLQCLAYVLAQPGVTTVLPGCKDVLQLKEALNVLEAAPEEKDFSPVLAGLGCYLEGECVYCNHCLPCPAGIDIGRTIHLLELSGEDLSPAVRDAYAGLPSLASSCTECGGCAERCPFGVDAPARIQAAADLFER